MEFFEAVHNRRSIRKYSDKKVPVEVMNKAIDAALLAPNSSNMQTWQFYWVRTEQKKKALVEACLSQSAATTAQELLVVSVSPSIWKKTSKDIIQKGIPAGLEKKLRLRHIKGLFNPNPRYPRPAPGDLSSFPHINPYVTRPPRHRGLCLGSGCYLEVIPGKKLVWTNMMGPGFQPVQLDPQDFGFVATIHFSPSYKAVVSHSDESGLKKHQQMGFQEGWGAAFDQLVELFKNK